MKHLGDITKISGYDAPVVDCIVGGSPCQDLSVAGLRKGLAGERSGLFMEQIRIIKEMREADVLRGRSGQFIRPRFAVWENVPGAQSSGSPKGADFAAVLTEFVRIAEPEAPPVSVPEKGWPSAGCLIDEMGAWSVAWRILDGQYWGNALLDDEGNILKHGTPQRRRRIALVADLGGRCAPEILFERTGLHRDTPQSGEERKAAPGHAEGSSGADDRAVEVGERREHGAGRGRQLDGVKAYSFDSLASNSMKSKNPNSGCRAVEVAKTLDTTDPNPCKNQGGIAIVEPVPYTLEPGIAAREGGHIYEGVSGTLRAEAGDNRMAVAYTLKIRSGCEGGGKGALVQEDKSATLATNNDQYLFQPVIDGHILDDQGGQQISVRTDGKAPTLRAEMHGNVPAVMQPTVYSIENHPADSRVDIDESGKVQTLTSRMGTGGGNVPMVMEPKAYSIQGNTIDRNTKQNGSGICENISHTLDATDRHGVAYCTDVGFFNSQEEVAPTLLARSYKDPHLVSYPGQLIRYIVRRLTPGECELLQGYPKGWTDIGDWVDSGGKVRKCTDSARYKALGNSICLPPWKWVLKRLCAHYERDATLASLFDGIGGFPLIWEQLNGKGTCLWASEIEEFPMAVTKVRFGE